MEFIRELLITAVAVMIAAYIIPGTKVNGFKSALIVALVLAVVSATVGALLNLITLPLNRLTFGLVGFLVGIVMIYITDSLVKGFKVGSFWSAVGFSLILAIVRALFL